HHRRTTRRANGAPRKLSHAALEPPTGARRRPASLRPLDVERDLTMTTTPANRTRQDWEQLAAATRPEGRALIDGRLVHAANGRVFEDISPIHGRVVAEVARCEAADVE